LADIRRTLALSTFAFSIELLVMIRDFFVMADVLSISPALE